MGEDPLAAPQCGEKAVESNRIMTAPWLSFTCCATLGRIPGHPPPPFPHLCDGIIPPPSPCTLRGVVGNPCWVLGTRWATDKCWLSSFLLDLK